MKIKKIWTININLFPSQKSFPIIFVLLSTLFLLAWNFKTFFTLSLIFFHALFKDGNRRVSKYTINVHKSYYLSLLSLLLTLDKIELVLIFQKISWFAINSDLRGQIVGNKAKGRISKRVFKQKQSTPNISYLLIQIRTCAFILTFMTASVKEGPKYPLSGKKLTKLLLFH